MTKKEITINGKTYPVVFNMKTILGFEEISGKSFFNEDFSMLRERIALVTAAVISADSNAELSIDNLIEADTLKQVQEILAAYTVVTEMATDFFKTPEVEPQPKEKEGEQGKN